MPFSTLNFLFKLPPLTSRLGECQDINTSEYKAKREEDKVWGQAGLSQWLLPSLSAAAMSHSLPLCILQLAEGVTARKPVEQRVSFGELMRC